MNKNMTIMWMKGSYQQQYITTYKLITLMKMNKNMTIMWMKGSYQQQYITTMRKTKRKRAMTTMMMMRMAITVPGAQFLIAHIMIWMSLPKKKSNTHWK